jgi:branched-chain amino acid aminotransferase
VTVDAVRNERSPLVGLKLTSWAENAALLRAADAAGRDDAVLCDTRGNLSECASANLFVVVEDELLTPCAASGCLPGIIRGVLLDHGLAAERTLPSAILDRVTEAFTTSSVVGVRAVARIDDRDLPVVGGQATSAAALIATG